MWGPTEPIRVACGLNTDHSFSRGQEVERRNFIRSRIRNANQLPIATIRNIVTCVRTFERWLSESTYADSRPIVEIPPVELDQCLADFYRSIKTPQGTEYKLQSKLCLRSNLDRYLKHNEYPSIVSSPVFHKSQAAFREWKSQSWLIYLFDWLVFYVSIKDISLIRWRLVSLWEETGQARTIRKLLTDHPPYARERRSVLKKWNKWNILM